MHFDIRDFEILDSIDRMGSLAAAAKDLYRTRSAITQSIKTLENQLSFKIFDREGYKLKFTKQGRIFLERGRIMLKEMQQLKSDLTEINSGWGGEFNIAYDDILSVDGILPMITEFQRVAPHTSITITREVLSGSWDALITNRADLVIGAVGHIPLDLECEQKTLGTVNFVLVAASNHPLGRCSGKLSEDDLRKYPNIIIGDTTSKLFSSSSGTLRGQPTILVPNMDAKIKAQCLGIGIGYIPIHRAKSYIENGSLIELDSSKHKGKAELKAIWRKEKMNKSLEWFVNQLDINEIRQSLFIA